MVRLSLPIALISKENMQEVNIDVITIINKSNFLNSLHNPPYS